MLAKAKAKAAEHESAAKKKVAEVKAVHEEKKAAQRSEKEQKWEAEVSDGALFKNYAAWKDVFEPKKQGSGGGGANEHKQKAKEAALDRVCNTVQTKVSANIVNMVIDMSAQVLSKASDVGIKCGAGSREYALAVYLNSIDAIIMTYRFQKKKTQSQCEFLRMIAVKRAIAALSQLFDNLDSDAQAKSAEAKADMISATVVDLLNAKQAEATAALEAHPMFNAGVAATNGAAGDPVVDDGVELLMGFLKSYIQSKVGPLTSQMAEMMGKGAFAALDAMEKRKAAKGTSSDAAEDEDLNKKMLGEVEAHHARLVAEVDKFVGGLVAKLRIAMDDREDDDEEEEA